MPPIRRASQVSEQLQLSWCRLIDRRRKEWDELDPEVIGSIIEGEWDRHGKCHNPPRMSSPRDRLEWVLTYHFYRAANEMTSPLKRRDSWVFMRNILSKTDEAYQNQIEEERENDDEDDDDEHGREGDDDRAAFSNADDMAAEDAEQHLKRQQQQQRRNNSKDKETPSIQRKRGSSRAGSMKRRVVENDDNDDDRHDEHDEDRHDNADMDMDMDVDVDNEEEEDPNESQKDKEDDDSSGGGGFGGFGDDDDDDDDDDDHHDDDSDKKDQDGKDDMKKSSASAKKGDAFSKSSRTKAKAANSNSNSNANANARKKMEQQKQNQQKQQPQQKQQHLGTSKKSASSAAAAPPSPSNYAPPARSRLISQNAASPKIAEKSVATIPPPPPTTATSGLTVNKAKELLRSWPGSSGNAADLRQQQQQQQQQQRQPQQRQQHQHQHHHHQQQQQQQQRHHQQPQQRQNQSSLNSNASAASKPSHSRSQDVPPRANQTLSRQASQNGNGLAGPSSAKSAAALMSDTTSTATAATQPSASRQPLGHKPNPSAASRPAGLPNQSSKNAPSVGGEGRMPIPLPNLAIPRSPPERETTVYFQPDNRQSGTIGNRGDFKCSFIPTRLDDKQNHDIITRLVKWDPYWHMESLIILQQTAKIMRSDCRAKDIDLPKRAMMAEFKLTTDQQRAVKEWGIHRKTKRYADNEIRLILRMLPLHPPTQAEAAKKGKKHRADTHLWPKGTFLMIDGNAEKLEQRNQQSHNREEWKGMSHILDLSSKLLKPHCQCAISLCHAEDAPYVFCLAICRYQSPETLCRKLMSEHYIQKISPQDAFKMAHQKTQQEAVGLDGVENDDGVATCACLPLLCPISSTIMKTPVRGKCRSGHFSCFDLYNFLAQNASVSGTRWECPVCSASLLSPFELQHCGFTAKLVYDYKGEVTSWRSTVRLSSDRTWELMPEKKLRYASATTTTAAASSSSTASAAASANGDRKRPASTLSSSSAMSGAASFASSSSSSLKKRSRHAVGNKNPPPPPSRAAAGGKNNHHHHDDDDDDDDVCIIID